MDRTLKVLNELVRERVIESYAIGGGVAGLFYMEPVLTYDMDVFVFLPQGRPGKLVSLSPIYEYLRRKGYQPQREQIVIEGVPVQFIPAYNDLVEEAVKESVEKRYKKTKTRILRAEHLVAIMLQTDRPKDRARMAQLLEEASIHKGRLDRILKRHDLWQRWHKFRDRFYEE